MNATAQYMTIAKTAPAELVQRHSDLVKRIAYHLAARLPSHVDVADLIQAGMIGLLEAARHYEDGHGAAFETYAGIRIRGAMLDDLRKVDWAPRSVHRNARQIASAIHAVERRTGADASDAEIAVELGMNLDRYHQLVADSARTQVLSLSADSDDEEGHDVADEGDTPENAVERDDFRRAVGDAINELPQRERLVMSMSYDQELNQREIGKVLNITESRVCQIHSQALVRLRARLIGDVSPKPAAGKAASKSPPTTETPRRAA